MYIHTSIHTHILGICQKQVSKPLKADHPERPTATLGLVT